MEEKKQTKQWKYSTSGKMVRGFLCIVTFCVFAVSMVVALYLVDAYGEGIFTNPEKNYMETEGYNNELNSIALELLWMIEGGYFTENEKWEMSILDVEESTIYTYYYDELVEDYKNGYYDPEILYVGEGVEGLDGYIEGNEKYFEEVDDLGRLKWYAKKHNSGYNYVYFSDEAFCQLFQNLGVQNKDCCFSDEFSEDAYFIFMNNSLVGKEAEELTFKTVNELNDSEYAVYDPEEEVFYSTKDDYFDFQGGYLYSVEEILALLDSNEYWGTSDIIFVLLHSFNFCNDYHYMIDKIAESENSVETAREHLSHYTASKGIYYYYAQDEFSVTNVTNQTILDSAEKIYTFVGRECENEPKWAVGSEFPGMVSTQLAELDFANNGVLQVAIDPQVENKYFSIVRNFTEYNLFKKYSVYILVIAILSFLLLIAQVVGLICTTGRAAKGDKEVHFNRYDTLVTELWAFLSFCIYSMCVFIILFSLEGAMYSYDNRLLIVLTVTTSGVLLFAIAFMEITLSFARRCKGHNLWNRSLLRRFYHFVKRSLGLEPPLIDKETGLPKEPSLVAKKISGVIYRLKKYFHQLKGTYKLLIAFVLYVIMNFICIIGIYDWQETFFVLLFAVWQLVALAVVVYIVKDTNRLIDTIHEITEGNLDAKVHLNSKTSLYKELGEGINHIGDGLKAAVESSLKDERMKTELITNVSHDLKTPLTSIINYINLLKGEKMPTPEAEHYIEVLDTKSQRLKQLTEDLVEAAKATSGNIELETMPLTFDELLKQAVGEFEDKYNQKNLTIVTSFPEKPAVVLADGRRLYRILENVMENAYKYALEGTRVYADLSNEDNTVTFTLKNISAAPLNISPEELMERFTRGDASRTTEGSGLGLSIAKDLTQLQGGSFDIILDGDLFKVQVTFFEHNSSSEDQEEKIK